MIKHKKEGIFPLSEKMPCRPRQIITEPYTLPTVFDGHLEAEEAAARIIWFSQQRKEWAGVSWSRLITMMKDDIALNNQRFAQRQRDQQEVEWRKRQRRRFYLFLTPLFWLASFRPKRSREIVVPVSGVYAYGLQFVRHGLRFLLDSQWLRQEIRAGNAVYFPTPKLVKRIMRKYDIIAK